MVKKKSVATKKVVGRKAVSSKSKAGAKSVRKTRWYIWVLIGLLFVIIGNQVYKYVATRQDVALLDSAEEKMRQLDFPGGEKGEIERYCSERSVKFGSPGKPTCGVGIDYVYVDPGDMRSDNKNDFIKKLKDDSVDIQDRYSERGDSYYNVYGFRDNLGCFLSDVVLTDYKTKAPEQHLYLYCQKKFQTKLYPIRD